jgi:GxxExxY protein
MSEIIYKDLSYELINVVYCVYNELGGGYQEKYYQRAVAIELVKREINYKEQLKVNLIYNNQNIGRYFLDFLIYDKIILELKVGDFIYRRDIKQVFGIFKGEKVKIRYNCIVFQTGS